MKILQRSFALVHNYKTPLIGLVIAAELFKAESASCTCKNVRFLASSLKSKDLKSHYS